MREAVQEAEEPPQQQQQAASKQQQRQAARQDTVQRKVQQGQTTLTFMGYDKAVLQQLPDFVKQQVPFVTTAKGALDAQLLEFITSLAVANVGFANIAKRLQELAHGQYYRRQLTYFSFAKEADAAAVAARGEGQSGASLSMV